MNISRKSFKKVKLTQSKNQYFEKILRDKDGKLVRATFCVYENGGRIKARLLEYVYVTSGAISGKVLSLASIVSKTVFDIENGLNSFLEHGTFNLVTIYSLGSKPRAPSFV